MYPTQYNYVLQDVRKDVDARRTGALASLSFAEEQERTVTEALTKVTVQFMMTGIAELDNTLPGDYTVPFKYSRHTHFSWVRYVKNLAVELRRPGVIVSAHPRYSGASTSYTVHISKRAYTKPLWAWFMLLPANQIRSDTRYWMFTLWSEQAEMLPAWRELCMTDSSYRAALRLT